MTNGLEKGKRFLTTGDAAARLGVPIWQVRRLFERGILPDPPRMGAFRVIPETYLPKVKAALEKAGYLPAAGEESAHG